MIAVVVVNWNGTPSSIRALRSVNARTSDVLPILVDNASREDPTPAACRAIPGVLVVRLDRNEGYAGGCNTGIEAAMAHGASHVLVLNNDAVLESGALDRLLDADHARPGSILAPLIVYASDPLTLWSAGGYVIRPSMKTHHLGQGHARSTVGEPVEVEWASGCALFFSVDTYRQVGPMDERFFLYLEDVDWCLRAARQDVATWVIPEAVVRHEVSTTVRSLPPAVVRYYSYRNHYRVALRHGSLWTRTVTALDLLWTVMKIGLRTALFSSYRHDRYYHARTRALLDLVRWCWGPAPNLTAATPPVVLATHPGP